MNAQPNKKLNDDHTNRDPLTGEAGSHPVGTGLGAAGVGTAATIVGAAVAGPLGAVVGAVAGAAAGGAWGHQAAESANPTYVEIEPVLRQEFVDRPYATGRNYEDYQDAYVFGSTERTSANRGDWNDDIESGLQARWENAKSRGGMAWGEARDAVKDAWHAAERRLPGDADRDGR